MTQNKILLVEGLDDQHVIWALLNVHKVPETFKVEQKGGISKLLEVLPVQLKGSAVTTVGVVIDADTDISARWSTVCSILTRLGYGSVPEIPSVSGTIISEHGLPKFGIWLMPDNKVTGMLEDFVGLLVPTGDIAFSHARSVLSALPPGVQKFTSGHFTKAHIHTWLAWQADPGTPLGLALTKKYLDATGPNAAIFVKWLNELFT